MSNGNDADYFANAVGLIVDRTSVKRQVLASAWLVAENKVATTADTIQDYRQYLSALEIVFPSAGRRFGVKRLIFHPQFKPRLAPRTVEDSLRTARTTATTKSHNCAILFLDDKLVELTDVRRVELDKSLSLEVDHLQQGLSGTLAEIEFSLLVQTLTSGRKEGELIIVDERNHPIAQVFCAGGRILFARYRHLVNELAVHQIVAQKLKNAFYFHSTDRPSWPARNLINVAPDALLLESYRRLDELERTRAPLGESDPCFVRKKAESELERVPAELKEEARALWSVADGLTPASRLWELVNFDQSTIFKVLQLLGELDLIASTDGAWIDRSKPSGSSVEGQEAKTAQSFLPLPAAPQLPLSPSDLLASIIVDNLSLRRGIKHGQLFGAIDAFDSYQLIHTLPMLPEFRGCPIFKNGYVVAMQVGALPCDPEVSLTVLQQCIWVESVVNCLIKAGEVEAAKQLTTLTFKPSITGAATLMQANSAAATTLIQASSAAPDKEHAGCVEVANIDCPRCGLSSFHTAQFCANCNFELIPVERPSKIAGRIWSIAAAAIALIFVVAFSTVVFVLPPANFADNPPVYLPEHPWLSLSVNQVNAKENRWELQPTGKIFNNGDTIHLSVDIFKPCHIYLLHQTNNGAPELLIPTAGRPDQQYKPGSRITYPEKIEQPLEDKNIRLNGVTLVRKNIWLNGITFGDNPGTETFVCLASTSPLKLTSSRFAFDRTTEGANRIYRWGTFHLGFEINQSTLESGQTAVSSELGKDSASPQDKVVYVTRLIAAHQK
jgi:hypothetical protein